MINVTIITPNFNDGRELSQRLVELSKIFPQDWEYLICDDCSTDDSIERVENATALHQNFTLLKNTENLGAIKTVNRVIEKARGKYILLISANDILFESFIELFQEPARTESAGIITSIPATCSEDYSKSNPSCIQKVPLFKGCNKPIFLSPDQMTKLFFLGNMWLAGHCTLLRRDLFFKYKGFDEKLKFNCDWYLNYQCVLDSGMYYIPEVCGLFKLHKNSYFTSFSREEEKEMILYLLKKVLLEKFSIKYRLICSGALQFYLRQVVDVALYHPKLWIFFPFVFVRRYFVRKKKWFNRYVNQLCRAKEIPF
ncbi:MAG: hypothetical protein S4CHLAM45_01770 [Chlamydiales bacterium]|nr:hypothetical protein [Chlamydiales bacterium]MCH9619496.1 hypothetical protein [Chlamydiales bacterium]MCH9622300.1 hypothetical protein [Chlamydiales bacterium]